MKRSRDEIKKVNFTYFCYRCGAKSNHELPAPKAPNYHHEKLKCPSCGDETRVMLSSCPNPDCSHYVYWIDDISIPDVVVGFAKYMVHNMQTMIDKAALQGATISIDTPDRYPINARCPCGTDFSVDIIIPDLD